MRDEDGRPGDEGRVKIAILHPEHESFKTLVILNMKNTDLVIFYSQVMSSALQVGNLHEIPCEQCFPDIDIVLTAIEVCAAHLEIESSHDANKLLSDIVRRLKCSGIDKVLVTPLGIFICTVNEKIVNA